MLFWTLVIVSQLSLALSAPSDEEQDAFFLAKATFDEGHHIVAPSTTKHLILNEINGTIYPDALSELKNVEKLRIYSSKLDEIKPGALCQSPKLQQISIGITLGQPLNKEHFQGCENLKELEMKYYTIDISPGTFEGLENLETLSTEQFKWGDLKKGVFSGLKNVKKISITDAEVSAIEPGTFKDVPKLEELILTNNKLADIHGNEFEGLSSLKTLNVDYNPTKNVDVDELLTTLPNTKAITIPYFYYVQLSEDQQKSVTEKFQKAGISEFYVQ